MSDGNVAGFCAHHFFRHVTCIWRDLSRPNLVQKSASSRRDAFLVLDCGSTTAFSSLIDHLKTVRFLRFKRGSHLRVIAHSFCKTYAVYLCCVGMCQFLGLLLRVLIVALVVLRGLSLLPLAFFNWKQVADLAAKHDLHCDSFSKVLLL